MLAGSKDRSNESQGSKERSEKERTTQLISMDTFSTRAALSEIFVLRPPTPLAVGRDSGTQDKSREFTMLNFSCDHEIKVLKMNAEWLRLLE